MYSKSPSKLSNFQGKCMMINNHQCQYYYVNNMLENSNNWVCLSVWLELGMYLSHITQKPWQVNVTRSVPNEVPNLACKKSPSFLSRSISKCLNFTFCCTFEPFLVMFTMEKVGKTYWYILHYAGKVSVYRIPYSRLYYVNVR